MKKRFIIALSDKKSLEALLVHFLLLYGFKYFRLWFGSGFRISERNPTVHYCHFNV